MNENTINLIFNRQDPGPIVLANAKGEKFNFQKIAVIPFNNNVYAILKPLDKIEGVKDTDVIVVYVGEENGITNLKVEFRPEIVNPVLERYKELLKEEYEKQKEL